MNGTTLRIATAAACVAALAAPAGALAKKHKTAHKTAKAPVVSVQVPHDYDAGGNGIELTTPGAGQHVDLFGAVNAAVALGNQALGQLGLPPVVLPQI